MMKKVDGGHGGISTTDFSADRNILKIKFPKDCQLILNGNYRVLI